jgi:WD40 repeat protein
MRFLSWGDDMYLRIWEVATGKALVENLLRPSGVRIPDDEEDWEPNGDFNDWRFDLGPAAMTPDGKSFVLLYQNSFRVFDVSTGREIQNLGGQEGRTLMLAVSPDGGLALTTEWGKPTTIQLAGGGMRGISPNHHIARVAGLKTGEQRLELTLPGRQAGAVAFNADGSLFAAAGAPPPQAEVFDTQTGQPRWTLDALPARVTAMVFSHDHRLLATALQVTTIIVWNLRAAKAKP